MSDPLNRGMRGQEIFVGTTELRAKVLSAQQPLPAHTIHVWRAALSSVCPLAEELQLVLSADEQARADKFRFPQHRNAFIAGRAVLRMILSSYCGCAPEALHFSCGEQGKPGIEAAESRLARTVSFNLSHSTNDLQIAVTAEGAVGIDVEDPRREFDVDGLVADCLTDEEAQPLRSLAAAQRRNAFIRYWVHKEAFLKCVGTGFSVPPKEVHVVFDGRGGSEMRCTHAMAGAVLFGRDLASEPGHLAAVATPERDCVLHSIVL